MNKYKKVLLKIYELDNEIVDDLDSNANNNQNKLYWKNERSCRYTQLLEKKKYWTHLSVLKIEEYQMIL